MNETSKLKQKLLSAKIREKLPHSPWSQSERDLESPMGTVNRDTAEIARDADVWAHNLISL